MPTSIAEAFEHCPRCGVAICMPGTNPLRCDGCDYTHYFSPTAAVAGILADHRGQVLFLKRERDPGKGKLGIPGGFIDAGETAENALHREVLEEVNLKVERIDYLASFPNFYDYKGVALPVCDLFFVCEVETFDTLKAEASEVAAWHFCHPDESTLDQMAFPSNRQAVELYLETVSI